MRMKWLMFLITVCFLVSCASEKLPPLLAFHVQTDNQEERDTLRVALTDPPSVIRVEKDPWLTEEDVEVAMVQKDGKVLLTLTADGGEKLKKLTHENQGRVLIIAFNQRVVFAPVMDQALDGRFFVVPYGLTPEDANYLNDMIIQKKTWKK
ncbi:MAG: hypothetical protein V1746_06435 [bacterium]